MKNFFTLSLLFLLNFTAVNAQLVVDNTTQTPADLVSNVLVGGGVSVSNITYNGSVTAAATVQQSCGEFSGTSSIGLANGFIMATGSAQLAVGPNSSGGMTLGSTGGTGGDPDLDAISTAPIYDKNIVEFDFVPQGDTIKFKYAFGSEEYPEYVCSTFNDVFGFFLTGTNPAGGSYSAENLALIPGTTLPVAINTVNPGVVGSAGFPGGCTSLAYSMYYVDNTGGTTIQYDGYTVVLEVKAAVVCGETYHIKLAIADAGDGALDSGVFLEAGSFSSNGVTVDLVTTSGTNTIMEGCLQGGTYSFTRPASSATDTLTITVDVSGNAINGVDYSPAIDSTITFLPGEDSVAFTFLAVDDAVAESVDSLVITIYNINACGDTVPSTATVYIIDLVPLDVSIGGDTSFACGGGTVPITPTVTGGYTPYSYSWSTGETTPTASPTITSTQDIILTVNGQCGTTDSDTMTVTVATSTPASWTGPTFSANCPDSVEIGAQYVSGGTAPYTYSWNTGETDSSHYVNPGDTTVYTVTITDACGNVAVVNITVNAQAVPHVWSATPVNIFCPNSATISPTFVSGGATPFSYSWSTGATTSSITVSPTDTTVYTVTITDVCDMVTVVNIPVNVQIVPQFWDPATFSTYCPFDPVTIGAEYVSGGTSPFTYSWSTGAITDSITVTPGDTTVYTVTITDACGETTTVPVTVDVRQPTQIEVSISSDTLCIQDGSVTLVPIVTNSNGGTVYTWSENGVPISNASTLVTTDLTTQTYVITVIDVCNSIDSDTSTVVIEACDITIPNIMTPNGDGLNEFWIITNLEKHPNTAVAIYNRWGQLMYENGAYQNNWDGGDVSDGVYFYVVTLTDGSTPANYHGTVQVARGN